MQAYSYRYTESEDSAEALIYITNHLDEIGFFEPMASAANQIANTGYSQFSSAVNNYVMGNISSLSEAVLLFQNDIQTSLEKLLDKKEE